MIRQHLQRFLRTGLIAVNEMKYFSLRLHFFGSSKLNVRPKAEKDMRVWPARCSWLIFTGCASTIEKSEPDATVNPGVPIVNKTRQVRSNRLNILSNVIDEPKFIFMNCLLDWMCKNLLTARPHLWDHLYGLDYGNPFLKRNSSAQFWPDVIVVRSNPLLNITWTFLNNTELRSGKVCSRYHKRHWQNKLHQ